jgi:hypothetical protein
MTRQEALNKAVDDLMKVFGSRITEIKTEASPFRIAFRKIRIDHCYTVTIRLDESNDSFTLHSFEVWFAPTGQFLGEITSAKKLKLALEQWQTTLGLDVNRL